MGHLHFDILHTQQWDENTIQLIGKSINTWITQSPCYQLSEEEHQANRRTDFKVIRL